MIDWESELPVWKQVVLVVTTLVLVLSAHWHSFRAARREVRERSSSIWWRRALSYVLRHQVHYVRQVPGMVLFIVASVMVVASL